MKIIKWNRKVGIESLDLITNNNILKDMELSCFDVYTLSFRGYMNRQQIKDNILKNISKKLENKYYCDNSEDVNIYDFIYVKVRSGRISAILVSNYICNYSQHKLKDVIIDGDQIILVFKERLFCSDWN